MGISQVEANRRSIEKKKKLGLRRYECWALPEHRPEIKEIEKKSRGVAEIRKQDKPI